MCSTERPHSGRTHHNLFLLFDSSVMFLTFLTFPIPFDTCISNRKVSTCWVPSFTSFHVFYCVFCVVQGCTTCGNNHASSLMRRLLSFGHHTNLLWNDRPLTILLIMVSFFTPAQPESKKNNVSDVLDVNPQVRPGLSKKYGVTKRRVSELSVDCICQQVCTVVRRKWPYKSH